MSAVEEYAEFKTNVKPLDDPIQEAFEVYADAAIAELEAENERLKWMLSDLAGAFDTKDAILADLERRWAERS